MENRVNEFGQPVGFPVADWQERERPPTSSMAGKYCTVELLDIERHAKSLFDAYVKGADGSDWTYLPYGPFTSLDSFVAWLAQTSIGNDPFFHVIVDPATRQAMGLASYLRIEPAAGKIEVGHIHYSQSLQRTTAATEAMYLMMCRIFDELGYRRYEWKCDALNERSRASALRLGFIFEGIFRQATVYRGRNRDTAWFSITDLEWAGLKQAYAMWLQAENFDSAGQQITTLASLIKQARSKLAPAAG